MQEQRDIISRALGTTLTTKEVREAKPLDGTGARGLATPGNVEVAVNTKQTP